jgi:hypothetical protein
MALTGAGEPAVGLLIHQKVSLQQKKGEPSIRRRRASIRR